MKKRRTWNSERIAQLELMAPDMTTEELADWFNCSQQNIREVCHEYGFRWCLKPPVQKKQLNAQESIALFKTQYINQPINRLLTTQWRNQ